MRPFGFVALSFVLSAPALAAQGGVDSYYRAAAEHFDVPASEVRIIADWELPPGEVPVVLFLSRRGGISADAVAALRRTGRAWADLASQYGVHAGQLHVSLGDDADLGPLARAYEQYRGRPSSGWPSIRLEDTEIIALVNVRFIADALNRPYADVLAALTRSGSPPDAYVMLARGG